MNPHVGRFVEAGYMSATLMIGIIALVQSSNKEHFQVAVQQQKDLRDIMNRVVNIEANVEAIKNLGLRQSKEAQASGSAEKE